MKKSRDIVERKLSGLTLLMPLRPGEEGMWVYELNESASAVWDFLDEDADEFNLVRKYREEFDVPDVVALRDVLEVLADFKQAGVLE